MIQNVLFVHEENAMIHSRNLSFVLLSCVIISSGWAIGAEVSTETEEKPKPFNFEEASRNVPKPRELYPIVSRDMVPMKLKIISDEMVLSDTDPTMQLRRITAQFQSLKLEGRIWVQPCIILMPADKTINAFPERRGKVVIMGTGGWVVLPARVNMYADPIVTRTGYPVMAVHSPGNYADGRPVEGNLAPLTRLRKKTGRNYYNMNCQLALVYIQAMNVFEKVLDIHPVSAVVGGHSKLGRSATVAAAMDSRVAGVVIMGNEGVYRTDRIQWHLSFHHAFFQEQVNVPVLYIGATNEGGYKMFNVNIMQERLKRPMTIEMIPNYRHYDFDERHYIDFRMWVAHVFDSRPITQVSDLEFERRNGRNYFRAKVRSAAKIRMVRVWYTFVKTPAWNRNLWFEWFMAERGDGVYEASVPGAMPDAFLVEVADIAQGVPGYVTSLPEKLTDAPVEERNPYKAPWMGPVEKE